MSVAKKLLEEAALNNIPVAIIGAKEDVVNKAVVNIQKEITGLNVVYYHDGYFNDDKIIYDELCAAERPNFFAIAAYNLGNNGKQTINLSENISSINEKCLVYLNENFLSQFKKYVILALKNAHKKSYDLKKQAIDRLNESKSSFSNIVNTQKEINSLKKEIVEVVENSINQLEITKDSISYTFNSRYSRFA